MDIPGYPRYLNFFSRGRIADRKKSELNFVSDGRSFELSVCRGSVGKTTE